MLPGTSEWMIILGIALLMFGPSKLPKLGGALGHGIRNFKKGLNGVDSQEVGKTSDPHKLDQT